MRGNCKPRARSGTGGCPASGEVSSWSLATRWLALYRRKGDPTYINYDAFVFVLIRSDDLNKYSGS